MWVTDIIIICVCLPVHLSVIYLSTYLPTYPSICLYLFCIRTAASGLQEPVFPGHTPRAPDSLSCPLSCSRLSVYMTLGLLEWYFLCQAPSLSSHRQLFHPGQKLTPGSQNSFALFIPDKVPVTENGLSTRFQYVFLSRFSYM